MNSNTRFGTCLQVLELLLLFPIDKDHRSVVVKGRDAKVDNLDFVTQSKVWEHSFMCGIHLCVVYVTVNGRDAKVTVFDCVTQSKVWVRSFICGICNSEWLRR
jgi:hypothetical protein